jgi:PAS domain S-box-containing protein/putative nucleotidyltransferase with HDIG domain
MSESRKVAGAPGAAHAVELAADALASLVRETARISEIAGNALRASETRYRRLFETAQDGILLINADTAQIEDVNPYLIKMLNYTYEEFLGKKLWEVGPFKDIAQSKEMFQEIQSKGYVRYEDLPLKTKGGISIEVEFVSNSYDVEGTKVIQCNIRDISERKLAEGVTHRYHEQLKLALMNTVEVATIISEIRDPYTAGHEKRVAKIASAIGAELGLDEIRQEGLRVAGYLHDVGKIGIPAEILSKPGKISPIEFQLIQGHAQASYDVLHKMEWPWPVAEVALQHHERMDGSGYPQGLKGDAILLEARIMAVADVIEAMSSHRPYRPAIGIDKALAEIERGRGTKFDIPVVDACLRLFRAKAFELPQ